MWGPPRGPTTAYFEYGAPLRSPGRSPRRLGASCGSKQPALTRPLHDGSGAFNQVKALLAARAAAALAVGPLPPRDSTDLTALSPADISPAGNFPADHFPADFPANAPADFPADGARGQLPPEERFRASVGGAFAPG